MLGSAFCYSLMPALVAGLGGSDYPFGFNFFYRAGGAVGGLVVLSVLLLRNGVGRGLLGAMWRELRPLDAVMLLGQFFGFTGFAFSTRYIDVAVTAMVFETWPLVFMVLMGFAMGRRRWFDCLSWRGGLLASVCLVGVILVVLSEDGVRFSGSRELLIGVSVAFLGMLVTASSFWNFRWCGRVVERYEFASDDVHAGVSQWLFVLVMVFVVGSLLSCLVNGAVSLMLEPVLWSGYAGWK